MSTYRKKLIEVALPLDAINKASAREKSIRHGHPSTLHLWWARRPLAACRAVLFASLVDDPSNDLPEEEAKVERDRLFGILEELVKWENSSNEWVLERARAEIRKSCDVADSRPPATDDIVAIYAEAEKFNGYDAFGGNDGLHRMVRARMKEYTETGYWQGTIEELRGTLFLYQRQWRWEAVIPPDANDDLVRKLYTELRRMWPESENRLPPVLDPFCGGGSIPLEAQRLGLEAHGSDLNPVAVLITKALIEIPPKFAGKPPVNPESKAKIGNEGSWRGAKGLAEDVRYYGKWMRHEAEKRIGHLYPKGPNGETVIAWLWARTVRCPNPACGATMPLVRSFELSKKKGKKTWVEPVVDRAEARVSFRVRSDDSLPRVGTINRRGATCIVCETAVPFNHVRAEGKAGRMNQKLMAVVAEGERSRKYLTPVENHVAVAEQAEPTWRPDAELPHNPRDFKTPNYGLTTFADLFTPRQLVALTTFSDLVGEARERAQKDAVAAGLSNDIVPLSDGGEGAQAYADSVATYLAFTVDRAIDRGSTICTWDSSPKMEALRNTFARQAIPMTWDFAEGNPFSESSGNWNKNISWTTAVIEASPVSTCGVARQADATMHVNSVSAPIISTDPPYYDNIGYADLSDFFYVWLRRSLGKIHPKIFGTMRVPKSHELVATPYRFGGSKQKAQQFFEEGLGKAFEQMRRRSNPNYPLTVYYAFKQTESENTGSGTITVASTGWETMLEGLLATGFQITGTWPMRSELGNRMLASGTNALASSIVLVCRPRAAEAPPATRQEFVRALRRELPDALSVMMAENIAPVDLAQATIGPGMAIYSRYSKVVEADGSPMRVRTALQIINSALDERLSETEGDVDSHTRFAITWFEQRGMQDGPYGEAESIATARNVSVRGVVDAGILEARAGKVHLLPRESLAEAWDPANDGRLTDWEIVQHLIRALQAEGEQGAAMLLATIGQRSEAARDLAYRLYGICERKGWADEALAYNGLVVAWPEITLLASQNPTGTEAQTSMEF